MQSLEDRTENIRRMIELIKMFNKMNIITISSFITPLSLHRKMIRDEVDNLTDIYLHSSLEKCIQRDIKGFYKLANKNIIKEYSGIDSLFEEPKHCKLTINTEELTILQSVEMIKSYLKEGGICY